MVYYIYSLFIELDMKRLKLFRSLSFLRLFSYSILFVLTGQCVLFAQQESGKVIYGIFSEEAEKYGNESSTPVYKKGETPPPINTTGTQMPSSVGATNAQGSGQSNNSTNTGLHHSNVPHTHSHHHTSDQSHQHSHSHSFSHSHLHNNSTAPAINQSISGAVQGQTYSPPANSTPLLSSPPALEYGISEGTFTEDGTPITDTPNYQSIYGNTGSGASPTSIYVPTFSNMEYANRINELNKRTTIPLQFNDRVKRHIDVYTVERRDVCARVLGQSYDLFPLFEEELAKRGMPLELKYLAVTESALNTHAVSRSGAVGLWQFMRGTGKLYKMRIDGYVDERRNPYIATAAAAEYLQDLYNRFGDWLIAIAAYNCGPGRMNSAIRRSGGKRDYWAVSRYLPRETRNYIPAFISCIYWMNHHADHNLQLEHPTYQYAFSSAEQVYVTGKVHLEAVAAVLGMPAAELAYINPAWRHQVIPDNGKSFALIIPSTKVFDFNEKRNQIYALMADPEMQQKYAAAQAKATYTRSSSNGTYKKPTYDAVPAGKTKIWHKVVKGDNVGKIASKYGVSASQVRDWNNITNFIKVGDKLQIFVSGGSGSRTDSSPAVSSSNNSSGGSTTYKIRSGDTLWSIAKKHGVSVQQIQSWNAGVTAKNIKPGQRLTIK